MYAPQGTQFALGGDPLFLNGSQVTLHSDGVGAVVNGEALSRLFVLQGGAALDLVNVNCTNGRFSSLVFNNEQRSGANGGAIYASDSNVSLVNVSFSNCSIAGASPAGGAIFFFRSHATLSGCIFDSCQATTDGNNSDAVPPY